MIKEVSYPTHLRKGITAILRDFPPDKELRVFGGDSETVRGLPHTVQIAAEGESVILFVDQDSIFPEFWGWIKHRLRRDGINLCYFHNLNFDLRVLFNRQQRAMYEQIHDIRFEIDGVSVHMLYGKVNKADLRQGPHKLTLLDSKAFTQASLDRSCKMFQVPIGKLPPPAGLGREPLRTPEFRAYALQDAVACRALGLRIMEFHRAYKIAPSVTLPAFAARVFRRHQLKPHESIPFPPVPCVKAAELSFHGGKNGYYLPARAVIEDSYEIDISSAYPFAMRELPPLTRGTYLNVRERRPDRAGIYRITGRQGERLRPLIFDHSFNPIPNNSRFSDLWVTGWELDEILKAPEIRIEKLRGYEWSPHKDAVNPFLRYVDHFYQKKQSAGKSDPFYNFYKLALNSLFGKLVSTIPEKSLEAKAEDKRLKNQGVDLPPGMVVHERYDPVLNQVVKISEAWKAGAIYNPFWASQITGHTRAYIARLESELDAFHVATDSVKTIYLREAVAGLGGLKVECFGRCYAFRNKLYLHCGKDATFCGHDAPPYSYPKDWPDKSKRGAPMVDVDGQHLCKFALHGFKGKLAELWDARLDIMRSGKYRYSYLHCVGLREGLRRKETPCDFVKREEMLLLDGAV